MRPSRARERSLRSSKGSNQNLDYHRLFGGQLLGQFVPAALATSPGKTIKSLHVLFAERGMPTSRSRYEVVRQQEGRTFATPPRSRHANRRA